MSDHQPVYITLDKPRRLWFRHQDVRDAIQITKTPLLELLNDRFIGYAYLLMFGLRHGDQRLTLNQVSNWIDDYIKREKANGVADPFSEIGLTLMRALDQAGFITIEKTKDDEGDAKNGQSPAAGSQT